MADILIIISNITYVLAGIFFITAVILFIRFRIPAIIGDLTGHTAKRSIAKMRINNEKAGAQIYKKDIENVTVKKDKNLQQDGTVPLMAETGTLDAQSTTILDDEATTILNQEAERRKHEIAGSIGFIVTESVILIHTDEVIV